VAIHVDTLVSRTMNVDLLGLQSARFKRAVVRLLRHLTALSGIVQDHYAVPDNRRIELSLTDAQEVNARAILDGDRSAYRIEFTPGMMVWLDSIAATIADDGTGDLTTRAGFGLLPDDPGDDWRAVFQEQLDRVDTLLPEDCHDTWEMLFQTFAAAIYLHEISHLLRGHIDPGIAEYGLTVGLDELALRRRPDVLCADTVRLLEFDADTYAARMSAHLAFEPPEFMPEWQSEGPKQSLINVLTGLALFYAALEHQDVRLQSRAPDYPTPLLRLLAIAAEMDRVWAQSSSGGDFYDDVFAAALSRLAQFETIYPELDILRTLLEPNRYDAVRAEATGIVDELALFEHRIIGYAFDGPGLWIAGRYE